jgi:hypothetical protein
MTNRCGKSASPDRQVAIRLVNELGLGGKDEILRGGIARVLPRPRWSSIDGWVRCLSFVLESKCVQLQHVLLVWNRRV